MSPKGDWILLESLNYVNNLFLSLIRDDELNLTMRKIFSTIVGKLRFYSGCKYGLHLMSNAIYNADGKLVDMETDHLYIGPSTDLYLDEELSCRHKGPDPCSARINLPRYIRLKEESDPIRRDGLKHLLEELLEGVPLCSPSAKKMTPSREQFFDSLNAKRKQFSRQENRIETIEYASNQLLIIPLAPASKSLPGGNLGTILLWDNSHKDLAKICEKRGERIKLACKIFSVFIKRLLESHYDMQDNTYLPSYRVPGQFQVAIMFVNIRNFTPTTEICRNFNLIEELSSFMKGYSSMVCGIVKDHGGRVHTLMGDGIIAIFGEYLNDPKQTVIKAINAASSICREFESLKKKFFEYENISEFQRKEYETMEFRIGIGINYGPVIFDYFGVSGNRIFAPLGDHVNFAQRLETEANRFDRRLLDRSDRIRAPILVSRPAWIASGKYGNPDPLLLSVKGRPQDYECYQYWP